MEEREREGGRWTHVACFLADGLRHGGGGTEASRDGQLGGGKVRADLRGKFHKVGWLRREGGGVGT